MRRLVSEEPDPEEAVARTEEWSIVARAMSNLPAREGLILCRSFGLQGAEMVTLREIGESMGVSRVRVMQLQKRALERLKKDLSLRSRKNTGGSGSI